ncbi:MAG: hypothetical protein JWP74_3736 [Marmoricola sp.]|nr:hypothetical protein [Marmoricola sp.]
MKENTGRRSVTFTGASLIATLILGLLMTTSPADARSNVRARHLIAGTRTTARWVGAVNTSSQTAVNDGYWADYAPTFSLSIGWLGGSLLGCLPGLNTLLSTGATLSSLNYVRSLAGLAPVRFSSKLNASAQRAALIMAANNSLSHSPSRGWKCWTSAGAAAAHRSNLALAYPRLSPGQVIGLYMSDPGADNHGAGHRRWILNPFSTVMGSGSTSTANALTVVGPTSASQPDPSYVAWPTAGWFPNKLEPGGRWSLSSGLKSVSFAHAGVSVYDSTSGRHLTVHKYPVENGYAQPTLVWQMPRGFSKTDAYQVVVSGIRRSGLGRAFSYAYPVRLFTPSH